MRIRLFCSYAQQDELACQPLWWHLAALRPTLEKAEITLELLSARTLEPGDPVDRLVALVEVAEVVVLLLSAAFFSSPEQLRELEIAARRRDQGQALILPVLLHAVDGWQDGPLGRVTALPRNGQQISAWQDKHLAWNDVTRGILDALLRLQHGNNEPQRSQAAAAPPSIHMALARMGTLRQLRWRVPLALVALTLGMAGYKAAGRCRRASPAELVYFPGGDLLVGGSRRPMETRQVGAFQLDRTEVAQAEYERWMQAPLGCRSPRVAPSETRKSDFPAVNVSYEYAERYCACRGARLPTEEEWIFAASGRERRPFPWGVAEAAPGQVNLCFIAPCQLQPVSGGAADITPEGVRHLGGNVREWVRGEEGPHSHRVMGGSYMTYVDFNQQASTQFGSFAGGHDADIGFRCAQETP